MEENEKPTHGIDEVMAEVHRHKEAISAEHNYDVAALIRHLRAKQLEEVRVVSHGKAK